MSIYVGLKPADALQKWYQLHHTPADQVSGLSPEEQVEAQTPGGMVTLAQENPAAWQLVKTGTPAVNDKRQVFNPMTGQFEDQTVRGVFSHPETWLQILAGAGLGGLAAAPAVAAASGGTTAGAAGGGAAAGTGAAAADAGGLLASTATVPLATGTIAGGTGLAAGTGAGVGVAGAGGAFDAAGHFIGTSTYDIPADVAGAGGRTYADLLRYGLPVAGGLAGALIQANASGNASAAQQKYLEDALAYEKENDLYNRGVAADKVKLEAGRYADYTGRIQPFIANATSSNDRMAALLGLPARPTAPPSSGGTYPSYGAATPTGVAVSPALTQRILDNYKTLGLTPTGPGSGPTDTAYYAGKYAETGGSTPANDAYWFGPGGRIATDAQKAGIAFTPTPTPAAPTPSLASRAPIQPKAALVPVRAPDGSVSHVPADQLDYYTQRGATVLGTAV